MEIDPDKWFKDRINEDLTQLHRIEAELYSGRTAYQSVRVMRIGGLGKCLVLDDKIQSSELDEFVYHEALVQPAMMAHSRPETVCIVGGGEGATLREVLSHKSVKRAVMVDIDEEVISLCRKYLPEWSRGAFEDSRTELYCRDARQFLAEWPGRFDVIVIDLPDPLEGGPAYLLYTQEFYQQVREKLNPDGIVSVQSGALSLAQLMCLPAVYHTLRSVFPIVRPYFADIPCFGTPWGFCVGSMSLDPAAVSAEEIDRRVAERSLSGLRFYDGVTHRGIFSLPKYFRRALASEKRIIKDNQPLYMYPRRA